MGERRACSASALWAVSSPPHLNLTCRVGSKEAKWVSCSLKPLSFSSYWLGEGQARLRGLQGRRCLPHLQDLGIYSPVSSLVCVCVLFNVCLCGRTHCSCIPCILVYMEARDPHQVSSLITSNLAF